MICRTSHFELSIWNFESVFLCLPATREAVHTSDCARALDGRWTVRTHVPILTVLVLYC